MRIAFVFKCRWMDCPMTSLTLNPALSALSHSPTPSQPGTLQVNQSSFQAELAKAATPKETPPDLLKMALPSWYGQYLSPLNLVNTDLNQALTTEINSRFGDGSQFSKDNPAPKDWIDKVAQFRNNDPKQQAIREKEQQKVEFRHELAQYGKILNGYMKAAYQQSGESPQDYFDNIKSDPVKDEKMHQFVHNRLMNNPRALQLMNMLGITPTNSDDAKA